MDDMQFSPQETPVSDLFVPVPPPPIHPLRKEANAQGGALLIYHLILNACVIAVVIAVSIVCAFEEALGMNTDNVDTLMERVTDASGWAYLAAVLFGFVALLIWKKPSYIRHTIWQKGKSMTFGGFLALLSLAMSAQVISQLCNLGLQWLLDLLGADLTAFQEMGTVDTSSLGMFLYVGIVAPISEELLFRGVLLRSLAPHGKKMSIFASGILFGLYHGNLIQTPYAFVVGLVLGYVALEYHVIWAIAIHIFNNLVFAMLLPDALAFLPVPIVDMIMWAVIIGFFVAALVVLLVKREKIMVLWYQEWQEQWKWRLVFGAPTMVVLIVLCLLNIGTSMLMLFL